MQRLMPFIKFKLREKQSVDSTQIKCNSTSKMIECALKSMKGISPMQKMCIEQSFKDQPEWFASFYISVDIGNIKPVNFSF